MITDNCNVNEPRKRKYLLKNRTNRAQNACKSLQSRARQPPPIEAATMRKSESSTRRERERGRARVSKVRQVAQLNSCALLQIVIGLKRSLLFSCSWHAHKFSLVRQMHPCIFKDGDNPAAIYVLLFAIAVCCSAHVVVHAGKSRWVGECTARGGEEQRDLLDIQCHCCFFLLLLLHNLQ